MSQEDDPASIIVARERGKMGEVFQSPRGGESGSPANVAQALNAV